MAQNHRSTDGHGASMTESAQWGGFSGTGTGRRINLPGHPKSNLTATILEHLKVNDIHYRKEREHYHNRKFNTVYGGFNLKP